MNCPGRQPARPAHIEARRDLAAATRGDRRRDAPDAVLITRTCAIAEYGVAPARVDSLVRLSLRAAGQVLPYGCHPMRREWRERSPDVLVTGARPHPGNTREVTGVVQVGMPVPPWKRCLVGSARLTGWHCCPNSRQDCPLPRTCIAARTPLRGIASRVMRVGPAAAARHADCLTVHTFAGICAGAYVALVRWCGASWSAT